MLSGIFPIKPDREGIFLYQTLYLWWRIPAMLPQKIMTCFVRDRIIHLLDMLFPFFIDHHMLSNNGAEIVQ